MLYDDVISLAYATAAVHRCRCMNKIHSSSYYFLATGGKNSHREKIGTPIGGSPQLKGSRMRSQIRHFTGR